MATGIAIGGGINIGGGVSVGSEGGGGGALVTGTITVGTWPIDNYGFSAQDSAGSISIAQTGLFRTIGYGAFAGAISFNLDGTYGDVIVSNFGGQINGSNTITLTIDGITKQITFDGMSWPDNADTFGLTTKLGQTLNLSMVVP
jgi:hypothetical protein